MGALRYYVIKQDNYYYLKIIIMKTNTTMSTPERHIILTTLLVFIGFCILLVYASLSNRMTSFQTFIRRTFRNVIDNFGSSFSADKSAILDKRARRSFLKGLAVAGFVIAAAAYDTG